MDAREYEPPSLDMCLPCDACISGGFSRCFFRVLLVGFGFFGPGAARAPFEDKTPSNFIIILLSSYIFKNI